MNTAKQYIPLFLIELYLFLGLWLLFYGPLSWPLENTREFLGYIFLYHLCFIAGYLLHTAHFRRNANSQSSIQPVLRESNNFTKHFWPVLILAFAANVILYRNMTLSHSFIPDNIFSGLYRGLIAPWEARAYYASDAAMAGFVKSPAITALLLFTAPFKYILLPGLVFYWHTLSSMRKLFGIFVASIPVLTGIVASLSVINFSYVFIISICLGTLLACKKSSGALSTLKQRKFFLFSLAFIFLFSFWQFYSVKSGQTPYQIAAGHGKPQTFDFLKAQGIKFKNEGTNLESSSAIDFYEKITAYMVQGYYGMSIAIGEEFDTSFGIGHSVFLQRTFADYLGLDVRDRTFQYKINDRWDQFVYWHSFYSYIANDVSFLGVSIVMLILGAYFSKIYLSAITDDDLYARMLLPLFGILFFYIPANNQVFGFLETMISFWILTVLFILSRKRKQVVAG